MSNATSLEQQVKKCRGTNNNYCFSFISFYRDAKNIFGLVIVDNEDIMETLQRKETEMKILHGKMSAGSISI